MSDKPKVYLSYTVANIIEGLWQDHIKLERSVIGRVVKFEDKFVVTDVFVPRQENKQAYTEMEDPLEDLQNYLIENNKIHTASEWRLWLHSHNIMQPFWSGTDNATRKDLCTNVFWEDDKGYGWSLSIVIGNGKKYHATIDFAYLSGDRKIVSSQDVEVVVGVIDDNLMPTDEEIDEFKSTLDYGNFVETDNIFPGDIATKLTANAQYNIELQKESQVKSFINSKIINHAIETEQRMFDSGVMIEIPTLDEYIAELKSKEKLTTYNRNNKKKENEKGGGGNLFQLFDKPSLYSAGFTWSHQKQTWVRDGDSRGYTYEEAQAIAFNDNEEDIYTSHDITYDDLKENGFSNLEGSIYWNRKNSSINYTMQQAKEIVAKEWNEFCENGGEDKIITDEMDYSDKIDYIESRGYSWDTFSKKWRLKTDEGIFSIFSDVDECIRDATTRFKEDFEEDLYDDSYDVVTDDEFISESDYDKYADTVPDISITNNRDYTKIGGEWYFKSIYIGDLRQAKIHFLKQ